MAFEERVGPGYLAAVDASNRLQQVGWQQRTPSLMPLAWAAQWLHYASDLKRRLAAPALVVPVFEQQVRGPGLSVLCTSLQWGQLCLSYFFGPR